MKKKVLAILLCLCLCLTIVPMAALADGEDVYGLTVADVDITPENCGDIAAAVNAYYGEDIASGTASYDDAAKTLTLNGFTLGYPSEGGYVFGIRAAFSGTGTGPAPALNIVVTGTNVIGLPIPENTEEYRSSDEGLLCAGDLVITGSGDLGVYAEDLAIGAAGELEVGTDFTGTLNARALGDAAIASGEKLTIVGGVVNAYCDYGAGVYSYDDIVIGGATVNALGHLNAIYAFNSLGIYNNAVVNAGDTLDNDDVVTAVRVDGEDVNGGAAITVSGSTLSIIDADRAIACYHGDIVINGVLNCHTDSAGYEAIYLANGAGSFTVTGGTVSVFSERGPAAYLGGGADFLGGVSEFTAGADSELSFPAFVPGPDAYVRVAEGLDISAGSEESSAALRTAEELNGDLDEFGYVKIEVPCNLYPVYIGGVQITDANKADVFGDGTVSYAPADGEHPALLTLNGAEILSGTTTVGGIPAVLYVDEDIEVNVSGTNVLSSDAAAEEACGACFEHNVHFTGTGALGICAPDADYQSRGIISRGELAVYGPDVTAYGGDTTEEESGFESIGIDARLTFVNTGSLTGFGGESEYESIGIFIEGVESDVRATVTDGSMSGFGGDAGFDSVGIWAPVTPIYVDGGSLTGTTGTAGSECIGIGAVGVLAQEDAEVTANAGDAASKSCGIYAVSFVGTENNGEIYAGAGEARGASIGIHSEGYIHLNGGKISAAAGSAFNSFGVYAYFESFIPVYGEIPEEPEVPSGVINVNGGELSGTAESDRDDVGTVAFGIYALNAMNVEDGHVIGAAAGSSGPVGIGSSCYYVEDEPQWNDFLDIWEELPVIAGTAFDGSDAVAVTDFPQTYYDYAYAEIGTEPAPDPGPVVAASEIVTPEESPYGEVLVSPQGYAYPSQTVTLTPLPKEHFMLKELLVFDPNDAEVPLTDNDDGTYSFSMPSGKVRIEARFMLDTDTVELPFRDVAADRWSRSGIAWCWFFDAMKGVEPDVFDPTGTLTRGMVMTVLARIDGVDTGASSPWYQAGVDWAVANGVSNGAEPEAPVTRQELMTMIYRYAQTKGLGFTGAWYFPLDYPDAAEVADWADEAVHWCTMKSIVLGYDDGRLDPLGFATREQAAVVFRRFCRTVGILA